MKKSTKKRGLKYQHPREYRNIYRVKVFRKGCVEKYGKSVFTPGYLYSGREPHVFGDRVYLFGSHDQAGGDTYCMLSYEFWSAPVDNLESWSCKGTSYRADQDPQYGEKLKYMYARCGAGQ